MTDRNFHIETARLYISYLDATSDRDCAFLVKLWNTPEFIASNGGNPTAITNAEIARDSIANNFREQHERNGYGQYLVSLKNTEVDRSLIFADRVRRCKPVGTISLMRGDAPAACTAPDLGFVTLPEEMRKGYAKEASEALLKYAEEKLGVPDIFGFTDPKNEASQAVFRSLGMEYRGVRPLKMFGDLPSAVWVKKGMSEDLSKYNI